MKVFNIVERKLILYIVKTVLGLLLQLRCRVFQKCNFPESVQRFNPSATLSRVEMKHACANRDVTV